MPWTSEPMDEGELHSYLLPWLEVAWSGLAGYQKKRPCRNFGLLGILLHWQHTQHVWYANVAPDIKAKYPNLEYVPEIDQYIEYLQRAQFVRGR